MRKCLAILVACASLAGCGIGKEIRVDPATGLSESSSELIFPPGAYRIRKEKDGWYSFERKGKKFLLYYPGDYKSIQILDDF